VLVFGFAERDLSFSSSFALISFFLFFVVCGAQDVRGSRWSISSICFSFFFSLIVRVSKEEEIEKSEKGQGKLLFDLYSNPMDRSAS